MTWLSIFPIRRRLIARDILTGTCVLVVVWLQWPQAVQDTCFPIGGCSQGLVGTALLALIVAGFPATLIAIVAHIGLTRLLFRHGEIQEDQELKIIAEVSREAGLEEKKQETGRKYDD